MLEVNFSLPGGVYSQMYWIIIDPKYQQNNINSTISFYTYILDQDFTNITIATFTQKHHQISLKVL